MASESKKKIWRDRSYVKSTRYQNIFGMSAGKARHKLRSKIIYNFFLLRDGDKCLRCNKPVKFENYSIDHRESFWEQADPIKAFFDIDDCFMSHRVCNYSHGREVGDRAKDKKKARRAKWDDVFGEG